MFTLTRDNILVPDEVCRWWIKCHI